jgi:hypothetical protein
MTFWLNHSLNPHSTSCTQDLYLASLVNPRPETLGLVVLPSGDYLFSEWIYVAGQGRDQ